jgi:putative hydrolase of the HAD superfamily
MGVQMYNFAKENQINEVNILGMDELKNQIGIKNIIFDFGGVILNINHKKLEEAFKSLGIPDFEHLFNQASQSELFQQFEVGKISPREFRMGVRSLTGLNITDDTFDNTWNKIINDFPARRINLLRQIKNSYKLLLLSNTNEIHYDYYIEKFRIEFGYDFQSLFHRTYWSFRMGKRKPDPDAYVEIISNERISPSETLFIDDSKQNIIAAANLGIKTLHLQNGMELTDLFQGSLLKL